MLVNGRIGRRSKAMMQPNRTAEESTKTAKSLARNGRNRRGEGLTTKERITDAVPVLATGRIRHRSKATDDAIRTVAGSGKTARWLSSYGGIVEG